MKDIVLVQGLNILNVQMVPITYPPEAITILGAWIERIAGGGINVAIKWAHTLTNWPRYPAEDDYAQAIAAFGWADLSVNQIENLTDVRFTSNWPISQFKEEVAPKANIVTISRVYFPPDNFAFYVSTDGLVGITIVPPDIKVAIYARRIYSWIATSGERIFRGII